MKKVMWGIAVSAVAALFVAACSADAGQTATRGSLRVCSTGDYRPFTHHDAQGWSGIDDIQIFGGLMGAGGQQVAHPQFQVNRPDVAAALNNPYWAASGWTTNIPSSAYGPGSVLYVYAHTPLAWAQAPLATAEVVEIMGGDEAQLRAELARCAAALPAGADLYWRRSD